MTIISTKCPTLNKSFKDKWTSGTPDLEVLVEVYDHANPGNAKALQIICPEYIAESKKCKIGGTCTYAEGFQPL